MKRLWILCVPLMIGATQIVFGGTTFPQLALGGLPGADEHYECIILISNKTDQIWSGQMTARTGNHEPWTIRWVAGGQNHEVQRVLFDLPAGGTIKVVAQSISGELAAGYLVLEGQSGFSESNVTISFFYNLLDATGDLLDSVSVPKASYASGAVLPVEFERNHIDTGLAWAPLLHWSSDFVLTFELLDGSGAVLETRDVPYEGQTATFISELFPDAAQSGRIVGRVRISCEKGMYITALRIQYCHSGFQLTGTPPDPVWD